MFAMQPWHKEMTFGKTMREEMAAKEHVFKHFFHKVDVLLRKQTPVLKYEVQRSHLNTVMTLVDRTGAGSVDMLIIIRV